MPYCGDHRLVRRHEGWSGPGLYDGSLHRGVVIPYLATEELGAVPSPQPKNELLGAQ